MVKPPNNEIKYANHHWIRQIDHDGRFCGFIVLQWSPASQRWVHSGDLATGQYADNFICSNAEYHSVCKQPE